MGLVESLNLILVLFSYRLYVFSVPLLSIQNILLKLNILLLKLLIELLSLLIVIRESLDLSLELQHPRHEIVGLPISFCLYLKKLILIGLVISVLLLNYLVFILQEVSLHIQVHLAVLATKFLVVTIQVDGIAILVLIISIVEQERVCFLEVFEFVQVPVSFPVVLLLFRRVLKDWSDLLDLVVNLNCP